MVVEKYPLLFGKFPNYYELLGVSGSASEKDVQQAYKRVALRDHPDKAGNTAKQNELFATINNAKYVLTDDDRRAHYDRELRLRGIQTATQTQPTSFTQQQFTGFMFTKPRHSESESSKGTGFRFKPNFRPFGSGSGFGPECHARQEDRDGRTASSKQAHTPGNSGSNSSTNQKIYDTGCPLCGSRFCPGSRYSKYAKREEIPCSNRDGQHSSHQASPDESKTPNPGPSRRQRRARNATSTKSQIPQVGDPDYMDPNRRWPFMAFKPPLSFYERHQQDKTKSGTGFWWLMQWKHYSLSEEHQKTADVTMEVCLAAEKVERTGQNLEKLCNSERLRSLGESYQRLTASLHLVAEVMHFAAAGYGYYSLLVDQSLYEQIDVGVPMLIKSRQPLMALLGNLSNTNALLVSLVDLLERPNLKLGPEALMRGICTIVAIWDHIINLPDNITQGAQDVFFSRTGQFENSYERRSTTSGYPRKPFCSKVPAQARTDQEHSWTQQDEELIRRKWEVGQRTREAQKDAARGLAANWAEADSEMTG